MACRRRKDQPPSVCVRRLGDEQRALLRAPCELAALRLGRALLLGRCASVADVIAAARSAAASTVPSFGGGGEETLGGRSSGDLVLEGSASLQKSGCVVSLVCACFVHRHSRRGEISDDSLIEHLALCMQASGRSQEKSKLA